MKPFLLRGAVAGIAGSIASVLVLLLVGESAITRAIELEAAAAGAGDHHDAVFSRPAQILGGAAGLVLYGLCLGFIFGVVYAAVRHRLGRDAEWRRARRLGAAAFVAVFLVPFLKYPANPPALGDPDTVGTRTVSYLSMVAISVLALVLAGAVLERLRARGLGDEVAQPLAALVWLLIVGVAMAVLPADAGEIAVPADLLWSFRLASLGGQAAFWAVTATVFGLLSARAAAQGGRSGAVGRPPATGAASPLA